MHLKVIKEKEAMNFSDSDGVLVYVHGILGR